MADIKVYKRKKMSNGIIIQLRHKTTNKSKSFTIQTEKSLENVEALLFDYLSSLNTKKDGHK